MATCNAVDTFGRPDGWCSGHEVVHSDGDRHYCVFHAPKEHKNLDPDPAKEIAAFNNLVFQEIESAIKGNRRCDLSGTIFPGDIDFSQYDKNHPLPEIDFIAATFSREAAFIAATFSGKAAFSRATFSREAAFIAATFSSKADFNSSNFSGKAYFNLATFSGKAAFSYATFGGDADFFGSKFRGVADFHKSTFGGEAAFHKSTFGGEADFRSARVNKLTFVRSEDRDDPMFKKDAHFEGMVIEDRVKFQNIGLEAARFRDADMRKIDFIVCTFRERKSRYILHDEEVYLKDYRRLATSGARALRLKTVEGLYRAQKGKAGKDHNQHDYSMWHYSEKEMMRQRSWHDFWAFFGNRGLLMNVLDLLVTPGVFLARIKGKREPWRNLLSMFILNAYLVLCGYGEDYVKAAFWVLAVFGLTAYGLDYAGLEPLKGISGDDYGWKLLLNTGEFLTFRKPTYFDAAAPLTVTIKLVAQVLFPIQATLFAFALRNRFRR